MPYKFNPLSSQFDYYETASDVPLTTATHTDLTGFIKGDGSHLSADNSTYLTAEVDPIVAAQTNGFTITRGTTPATLTVAASGSVSGTNSGDGAANSSSMYIGTTSHALNRASAAETLAGITLTTPEIGAATGTSVDLGATTLYGSRAITVDTGGVLNVDIGSAAGDDFTVDTNKLVVEGDTGNVGIGTTAPNQALTVENSISLKEIASANADTAAYGQIWVKTATPNELWFTNDAGTDVQLGVAAAADITSVGDVTTGAAFDGTQGTTLTFYNAGGNATCVYNGTTFTFNKFITANVTGALTGNADTSTTCSGNAGTVTNGVYTTGNQSIAGIKTLSDATEASSATVGGTIISGGLAVAKRVYATDMTVTNKITGSISGTADGNALLASSISDADTTHAPDGNSVFDALALKAPLAKRVTTANDATSITPNTDTADITYQANTQAAGTLTINADGGTPVNGRAWLLKIKSTNVQTFSWNALYVGGNYALPISTTGGGKIDYYAFIYDSVNSKFHFTGSGGGF